MKKYALLTLLLPAICGMAHAQNPGMKKHEISASYGISPTSDYISLYDGLSIESIPGNPVRKGSVDKYGAVGLNYTYRINKLFGVGVALGYSAHKYNLINNSNIKIGKEEDNYYSVMPRLKINWLNGNNVTFYSLLAAGVTFTHYTAPDVKLSKTLFAWQASPLGLEIGNTIAGFAEVGIGQFGVALIGARIRF